MHRRTFLQILTGFFLSTISVFSRPLTLAKTYEEEDVIKGWLMSEKLDGIRAVWDGRELMSKQGNPISAPKKFLDAMPPFPVEGELWTKRSDFERITSIVLDDTPGEEWQEVTFQIFESSHSTDSFSKRLARVSAWLEENPSQVIQLIEQIPCESKQHLQQFLAEVESKGGEGVILRDPMAAYEAGRSDTYLKVKSFLDSEGRVIGYREGKGKYAGQMGSLHLELENGQTFYLGSGFDNAMRKNPPPVGTVVTFKYQGLTRRGKPRFASFLRVRKDYVWKGRQ